MTSYKPLRHRGVLFLYKKHSYFGLAFHMNPARPQLGVFSFILNHLLCVCGVFVLLLKPFNLKLCRGVFRGDRAEPTG